MFVLNRKWFSFCFFKQCIGSWIQYGSWWTDKVEVTEHFLEWSTLMVKKKTTKKTTKETNPKTKKTNPCWDGYEPVPGKKPGSKGSCRLKEK